MYNRIKQSLYHAKPLYHAVSPYHTKTATPWGWAPLSRDPQYQEKRWQHRVKVVLMTPIVFFYPKKKHISKLAKIKTGVLRTILYTVFGIFCY